MVDLKTSFCMHCKKKVDIKDPIELVSEGTRGLRRYLKGICSICGTKTCKIIGV